MSKRKAEDERTVFIFEGSDCESWSRCSDVATMKILMSGGSAAQSSMIWAKDG